MKKLFTASIIGCGSRGVTTYGRYMVEHPDEFKIVSICDIDERKTKMAGDTWNIPEEDRFLDEKTFFEKKRSDALVIATQDRDHVRMCIRALELGYDVLLEKPISPVEEELHALLDAQKKYGGKVVVCHVLRYAPAYLKLKELLDSGKIGKLICFEWIEQVAYWHQAHSFVRGNWRNSEETSPMIMQKCCHDMDLLQYYANSACKTVYSTGDLSYFKKENQPEGASARCQDCKYINTCPYSAEITYVERWKKLGSATTWPFDVVDLSRPITEESLRKAYQTTPYGRCVFDCDNDVVDNQKVSVVFENGVKASLTMTAFTALPGRRVTFHGSLGEIEMDDFKDYIRLSVYEGETVEFSIKELIRNSMNDAFGHGGGDPMLVKDFYKALTGEGTLGTTLDKSVESHLMALCAEKSRLTGEVVYVHGKK